MNKRCPLLEVRFDGWAVGPRKIPVRPLLHFLTGLNRVLQRVGRVLQGASESHHKGRRNRALMSELELDLMSLTEGSPAAVLGFERRKSQLEILPDDFGQDILQCVFVGLEAVQQENQQGKTLPTGYDAGVLMAWRDTGKVFQQGIERVAFTLNRQESPLPISFTPNGVARIQERIRGPQANVLAIEGRLLMADFKEHGMRCRVHPAAAEPILCLFNEAQNDEVLRNILRYVRIFGEAQQDPLTGRIASIEIRDIESLDNRKDDLDLLARETGISKTFWESQSLEELANSQDVDPVLDVPSLFGTWPGEIDDGFEAAIDELRHPGTGHGGRS